MANPNPDLEKHARMKALLIADTPLAEIARLMGYASDRSVMVMVHRWGLVEHYSHSYVARARRRRLSGGRQREEAPTHATHGPRTQPVSRPARSVTETNKRAS